MKSCFVTIAVCVFAGCESPPQNAETVQVESLSPQREADGTILAQPHDWVTPAWKVTNHTDSDLRLQPAVDCKCKLDSPFPEVLPAHSSAELKLRFPPPEFGTVSHTVPLLAEGRTEPVAIIEPRIKAVMNQPRWLQWPSRIDLYAIEGDEVQQTVEVISAEKAAAPVWLEGAMLEDSGGTVVVEPDREQPTEDASFVRRHYRLHLTIAALPAGRHQLRLQPQSSGEAIPPVAVHVDVKPPLSTRPERVTLTGTTSAELIVINRTTGWSTVSASDSNLLRVEAVPESDSVWRVSALEAVAEPIETTLVVALPARMETLTIPVTIQPSPTSEGVPNDQADESP